MPDTLSGLRLMANVAAEKSGGEADVPLAFPIGLDDIGNGKRFARDWKAVARYCYEWKEWVVFDGARWRRDNTGEVFRLAKETVAGIKDEVAINGDGAALNKHWHDSQALRALNAMLTMAESEIGMPCLPEDFDQDQYLLNTLDGTIELKTNTFREHRRDDMLMHLAPVHFNHPDAHTNDWLPFVQTVLPPFTGYTAGTAKDKGVYRCITHSIFSVEMLKGDEFPFCHAIEGEEHTAEWECWALLEFVQRFAGLCLSGDVTDEAFFLFLGNGANGKSTFLSTLQTLLGDDLATELGVEWFVDSKFTAGRLQIDVHAAKGKRLTVVSECPKHARLDVGKLKRWSGGDRRSGKGMKENLSVSRPHDKLVFTANTEPGMNDQSAGMRRRFKLVPFRIQIPEHEIDGKLKEKLSNPPQLCGILRWCLEGFKAWTTQQLAMPDIVREASTALLVRQDQIANFVSACLVRVPGAETEKKPVYELYKRWCEENGEGRPSSNRVFAPNMIEQGFSAGHRGNYLFWIGLEIATQFNRPKGNATDEAELRKRSDEAAKGDLFQ